MNIIKGPTVIKGGFNASAFVKAHLGDSTKVKLPFTAKGWKSTKNPVVVEDGKAEYDLPEETKANLKEVAKKEIEKIVKKEGLDKNLDGSIDTEATEKIIKKSRTLFSRKLKKKKVKEE